MMTIDNIILGDNQFFGVNHMSQDKGRVAYEKFKDISEIKKILFYAMDNGVKGVMFSTHPSIYQITDMMRKDAAIKNNFSLYINVPYIVKYMSMINEMGMYNTIKTMLRGKTFLENAKYVTESAINVLTKDYLAIVNRLIDVELAPFYDLNIKAVFLHNILADLALGYNMVDVIKSYDSYIKKKYNAIPAYGTLNYPAFCDLLKKADIKNSLIMTAVNKKGFLMNPDIESYKHEIAKNEHTVLAMATLASGRIPPQEAYEFLFSLNIKHVVVGLSSQKHADETFGILKKYLT